MSSGGQEESRTTKEPPRSPAPLDLARTTSLAKGPLLQMSGQTLRGMRVICTQSSGSLVTTSIVPQAVFKSQSLNTVQANGALLTPATSRPPQTTTYHVPRGPAVVANLSTNRPNSSFSRGAPLLVTARGSTIRAPTAAAASTSSWLTATAVATTNNTTTKGVPVRTHIRPATIMQSAITINNPNSTGSPHIRAVAAANIPSPNGAGNNTAPVTIQTLSNAVTIAQIVPQHNRTQVSNQTYTVAQTQFGQPVRFQHTQHPHVQTIKQTISGGANAGLMLANRATVSHVGSGARLTTVPVTVSQNALVGRATTPSATLLTTARIATYTPPSLQVNVSQPPTSNCASPSITLSNAATVTIAQPSTINRLTGATVVASGSLGHHPIGRLTLATPTATNLTFAPTAAAIVPSATLINVATAAANSNAIGNNLNTSITATTPTTISIPTAVTLCANPSTIPARTLSVHPVVAVGTHQQSQLTQRHQLISAPKNVAATQLPATVVAVSNANSTLTQHHQATNAIHFTTISTAFKTVVPSNVQPARTTCIMGGQPASVASVVSGARYNSPIMLMDNTATINRSDPNRSEGHVTLSFDNSNLMAHVVNTTSDIITTAMAGSPITSTVSCTTTTATTKVISSPRPNILRKRDHDGSPAALKAAKNLLNPMMNLNNLVASSQSNSGTVLNIGNIASTSVSNATITSPLHTDVILTRPASISRPDSVESRGNGGHSSNGSTTISATSSPGLTDINDDKDTDDALSVRSRSSTGTDGRSSTTPLSNYVGVITTGYSHNNNASRLCMNAMEMSPRKKPRKQQLTGNDLNEANEDIQFLSDPHSTKRRTHMNNQLQSLGGSGAIIGRHHSIHPPASSIASPMRQDSVEDVPHFDANDDAHWASSSGTTSARNGTVHASNSTSSAGADAANARKLSNVTLLNSYRQTWKATHNHYVRYTDVRPKEERRPTIIDLANQYRVQEKVHGWKIYHLSTQMEDLAEEEHNVYDHLSNLLKRTEQEAIDCKKDESLDKEINCISELIKGNLQRIKIINDGMMDAKTQIMKIFDHKVHVTDIINRCASKRSYKKREK